MEDLSKHVRVATKEVRSMPLRVHVDRIARLTRELSVIQQLEWPVFQRLDRNDQSRIVDNLLKAGLVEGLTRAADRLSNFLWCYIDSAAANKDAEVDYAQQSQQLEQITQLLRLLHQRTGPTTAPLAFVERMTSTIERRVEEQP